jgi:hypothetical protein
LGVDGHLWQAPARGFGGNALLRRLRGTARQAIETTGLRARLGTRIQPAPQTNRGAGDYRGPRVTGAPELLGPQNYWGST